MTTDKTRRMGAAEAQPIKSSSKQSVRLAHPAPLFCIFLVFEQDFVYKSLLSLHC